MEYAIESAALFNPSMVPAIDQADMPSGSVRFLMSLRNRRGTHFINSLSRGRHRRQWPGQR